MAIYDPNGSRPDFSTYNNPQAARQRYQQQRQQYMAQNPRPTQGGGGNTLNQNQTNQLQSSIPFMRKDHFYVPGGDRPNFNQFGNPDKRKEIWQKQRDIYRTQMELARQRGGQPTPTTPQPPMQGQGYRAPYPGETGPGNYDPSGNYNFQGYQQAYNTYAQNYGNWVDQLDEMLGQYGTQQYQDWINNRPQSPVVKGFA